MPFEELPDRLFRTSSREKFAVYIDGKFTITIWFPKNHSLCAAKRIRTQVGTGDDIGLVRIMAGEGETGRAMYAADKEKTKGHHVKYTTLPGAPRAKMLATDILSKEGDGWTELRMPWRKDPPPNFAAGTTTKNTNSAPTVQRPPPPQSQIAPRRNIMGDEPPKPAPSAAHTAAADFAFGGKK